MKSRALDPSLEPASKRPEPAVPSRAPVEPEGAEKALFDAGAMGNQAFQQRNRPGASAREGVVDMSPAAGGAPAASPSAATSPGPPVVDGITIVDSPAGAVTGFPTILGRASHDVPGPFNDQATGECRNSHQVHFHLASGSSGNLTPRREVKRSVFQAGAEHRKPTDLPGQPGGFGGTRTGPDGPGPHVLQPSADLIAIADAPGTLALTPAQYPFVYSAAFTLTVASGGLDIARTRYYVFIEKNSATSIPNEENTVFPIEKKDLINNRDLP